MWNIAWIFLLAVFAATSFAADVVLKPANTSRLQVAMVFIEGAQIAPEQYIRLARAVQNSSNYLLWVGIPQFTLAFPEPVEMAANVERIIKSLQSAGMNTTRIFFAAHSLGGAILQDYLFSHPNMGFSQVLMGSFLLRKYRNQTYPVPTLTIGGELDGLCRVTRIMEAFYHRVLHAQEHLAVTNFPVVTVGGMTHMQFASGTPPWLVKLRDLKPEITYEQAHSAVAALVAAFIALHLGDTSSFSIISQAVDSTAVFMEPLVSAFELEGYHNFKPPCNDIPPSSACQVGSEWSRHAQVVMDGLKEAHVNDTDTFHPVDQINPIHLPHINNNCSSPTPQCILQTMTVTQNVYEVLDTLDAGIVFISASEMRVKMSSRQAVMVAAGYKNVNFNESDEFSICKIINQDSYQWALNKTSKKTLDRFMKYGEPYVMGDDEGPYNVGQEWIWDALHYKKMVNSKGDDVIDVRSPTLRTPLNFFIKASAGFHYCKLLSPARAILYGVDLCERLA